MLFWISTKTLHFSNHCAVVKTRERHNLPTSSLKTMKSKFIKQRITDFFWRFSADICHAALLRLTSSSVCCVRLPQVDVNHRRSYLTSFEFIRSPLHILQISAEIFEPKWSWLNPNGQSHEDAAASRPVGTGAFRRAPAKMDAARSRFSSRQEQKAPNYTKYLIDGPLQRGLAWGANGCNPPFHNNPAIVRAVCLC